ncbi:MAG: RHS repeat-associated core domain-containing protein, partial [Patescibacteria group bacterium]|nr:RHS repeat-associated core domain-containing protein [Patescibacteria group bacterium]
GGPEYTASARPCPRDQLAQIDYNSAMVATFAYDNGLRRTSRVLGDTPGTQTAWVYGRQDNLPTAINSAIPGASFSYTYDANKNTLTEGISAPMANFGFNSTAYDQADRLTAWNRTDGNLDQAWNLSLVGNWAAFTENQVQQTRTHTAVHEIAAIDANPIAHDPAGNLIRNAGDTLDRYTWDFDNRLATADTNQDGTAECGYQYDARGKRVSNTVPDGEGSVTTVFVYLGNQVVSEYAADALPASPERKFVYATYIDEPVVMIDRTATGAVAAGTDELLFYHCNSLYSVAAITETSGTVVERCAYSAYGKPLIFDASMQLIAQSAIANPYAFTGRRLDPETSLYYYRARMYDAELGRFVSRDPIGYEAGDVSLYRYVGGRPLYDTDPLGLAPDDPADPCDCCKDSLVRKFGFNSVAPDGRPVDPNSNALVQDYEAPNGNDCRVTLSCEQDCGRGPGVGTTTHPNKSVSPGISYVMSVCIPCTSLSASEADALLEHEWVHVIRFCQAGKGPSTCDDCALHETAAYKVQCDMLHSGRPGASDAIKECIQCGVWNSCKDFIGTDGERCGKEGSPLDKNAKQLKCK